jgi:hypothetical protein
MKRKITSPAPYYEIVKYNLKTREDLDVLPEQFFVLSEVNDKIATLNARLKASKEGEGGAIIYFRRRVRA